MKTTPLEVTLQAGEFEVIKSIFQTSIPYILGWNTTMDIASAAAMSKGMSGGGNHYWSDWYMDRDEVFEKAKQLETGSLEDRQYSFHYLN